MAVVNVLPLCHRLERCGWRHYHHFDPCCSHFDQKNPYPHHFNPTIPIPSLERFCFHTPSHPLLIPPYLIPQVLKVLLLSHLSASTPLIIIHSDPSSSFSFFLLPELLFPIQISPIRFDQPPRPYHWTSSIHFKSLSHKTSSTHFNTHSHNFFISFQHLNQLQ